MRFLRELPGAVAVLAFYAVLLVPYLPAWGQDAEVAAEAAAGSTNGSPEEQAAAALKLLKRSEAAYGTWLDCAFDAANKLGKDFGTPADEAATAAVDGCLTEQSANRSAIDLMFWENSDREERTERLHESLRRNMVRTLSAEIVKLRAKARAMAREQG